MIWRTGRSKKGDKIIKQKLEHIVCCPRNGHPQFCKDAMLSNSQRLDRGIHSDQIGRDCDIIEEDSK